MKNQIRPEELEFSGQVSKTVMLSSLLQYQESSFRTDSGVGTDGLMK